MKQDVRWYVWLPGLATLISVPFAYYVYTHEDPWFGLWVYAIPTFWGPITLARPSPWPRALGLRVRALAAASAVHLEPHWPWSRASVRGHHERPSAVELWGGSLQMALVIVLIFNVLSTASYLFAGRTLKGSCPSAELS